jgi:protein PsiE
MDKIAKNLQLALMVIILISTVIAVGIEINKMFLVKSVTLADLLLMFLYLEVLAMVRVFWDQQSISITLPLLIAITALSRFIILQGKEMDPSALVYEAVAIVLIAGAIVILRLRHSEKLAKKNSKKMPFVKLLNKVKTHTFILK